MSEENPRKYLEIELKVERYETIDDGQNMFIFILYLSKLRVESLSRSI